MVRRGQEKIRKKTIFSRFVKHQGILPSWENALEFQCFVKCEVHSFGYGNFLEVSVVPKLQKSCSKYDLIFLNFDLNLRKKTCCNTSVVKKDVFVVILVCSLYEPFVLL